MKDKKMKTVKNICQCIVVASLALAVGGLISAPASAQAQQKGAEKLLQVKTVQDLQSIDAGDKIVMSCPKCKDTYVTVVEKSFKGANQNELKTMKVHLCSACETKWLTKGHGKTATQVMVHTCKACGSTDVSCCVMKK
jgi:hypothetical protein